MPTPSATPDLAWFGDRCLRVEFSGSVEVALRNVHAAFRTLRNAAIPALLDVTPAYRTLLLTFDPIALDSAKAERQVVESLRDLDPAPDSTPILTVEIPVCYDPSCAPDIEALGHANKLSIERVAELHSGATYTVAFIGFSPGFPYLTGLPRELHTPRHPQPRTRVAAGSVGIAGDQTGIYPHATPGGWQLIGRTPLTIFDATRDPPALLAPGDRVRFSRITLDRFRELAAGGG